MTKSDKKEKKIVLKKEKEVNKEKKTAKDVLAKAQKAIDRITKEYGKGVIRRYSDRPIEDVSVISTSSIKLDNALGIGGVPRGRIVEIYGPEAGGKTTLSLQIAANVQKMGGVVAFVDAEHSLDPAMARSIGVDVDNMLISQPDYGEQALNIVEVLVEEKAVDLVIVDSVSALTPRAEIEGEMGDSHMGLQARLMSQAMRKVTAKTANSKACVLFINQLRDKIGVMFGSPKTTSGGNALKFYASVRLEIGRIGSIKQGDDVIGNRVKIKVVKNKLAPPYKKIETELIFGKGLNYFGEVIDIAKEYEVVEQSGPWYSYGDERIGQGKQAACKFLEDNPKILENILTDMEMVH